MRIIAQAMPAARGARRGLLASRELPPGQIQRETTYRTPLYRTHFNDLYGNVFGTDSCLEEALANAYACRKVLQVVCGKDRRRKEMLRSVLAQYVQNQPPGYRRGIEFIKNVIVFSRPECFCRGESAADAKGAPGGKASFTAMPGRL